MTPFPNHCDGYISVPYPFLYKEPSHRSEIVSQLWFSEPILIHETNGQWALIETLWDHYTGWCLKSVLFITSSLICKGLVGWLSFPYSTPLVQERKTISPTFRFLFGHPFFQYNNTIEGSYLTSWGTLTISPHVLSNSLPTLSVLFSNYLISFIGIPYMWGGKSPLGADCSGLTQWIYTLLNIRIPRDSHEQAKKGKGIPIDDIQAGDLLFFSHRNEQDITHVGIYLGNFQLLHLSEKHGISTIDRINFTGHIQNLPSYVFTKACRYI